MWKNIAKIIFGFPLKYVSGFIFAIICCVVVTALSVLVLSGIPGCAAIGAVVGAGIFVGIPIGATLGITLVDKLFFSRRMCKRPIVTGVIAGSTASVFLGVLDSYGVKIFDRLPHDGLSSILYGYGVFYILGVLAALLGYTIVGMVGCRQAEKPDGYVPWGIAGVILGLPLEYVAGFTLAVISCFAVAALVGPDLAFFVGIPVGAALGIMVLDRFVFMRPFLKRQLFSAIILSVATSIFLAFLDRHGIRVHERISWDGPASMLFGYGVFYIIDVLAALLAYTIAGLTKPRRTTEVGPQKQDRGET